MFPFLIKKEKKYQNVLNIIIKPVNLIINTINFVLPKDIPYIHFGAFKIKGKW